MSCCHEGSTHSNHMHTTIWEEVVCHFPYALIAVALSIILLTILGYSHIQAASLPLLHDLFHTLHFLHLLFAGTGTVLMYRRYSHTIGDTLIVGTLVPLLFCTLSDAIMPYFGGLMCGIDMHFHWCLFHHTSTIALFLGLGIFNGYIMSFHRTAQQVFYSHGFHFMHIFISAFASTVYLISNGFTQWNYHLGFVFSYLLGAVVIPCTLADVIVPIVVGNLRNKKACD